MSTVRGYCTPVLVFSFSFFCWSNWMNGKSWYSRFILNISTKLYSFKLIFQNSVSHFCFINVFQKCWRNLDFDICHSECKIQLGDTRPPSATGPPHPRTGAAPKHATLVPRGGPAHSPRGPATPGAQTTPDLTDQEVYIFQNRFEGDKICGKHQTFDLMGNLGNLHVFFVFSQREVEISVSVLRKVCRIKNGCNIRTLTALGRTHGDYQPSLAVLACPQLIPRI